MAKKKKDEEYVGQFDLEFLLENYVNYFKSLTNKYKSYANSPEDIEDLFHSVQYEFIKLVNEYDPRRGVDFPGYIKKMLPFRVYHFVLKNYTILSKETTCGEVYDLAPEGIENCAEFEYIEDKASLDTSKISGKKRQKLLEDIMVYRKTLEQIAEEEGTSVKIIRLRFHFLIDQLKKQNETQD